MKRLRSTLALLMILCLVLPMVPVRAAEEDALQSYLEECLTYYLLAEDLSITSEIYYLSQGIEIAGGTDDGKRIYFLFDEKEAVGMLLVTMIDGTYTSNFIYGTISEVTKAYQLGVPIALYVDRQGDLFLWTSFGVTLLYGPQSNDAGTADDFEFSPVILYNIAIVAGSSDDYVQ